MLLCKYSGHCSCSDCHASQVYKNLLLVLIKELVVSRHIQAKFRLVFVWGAAGISLYVQTGGSLILTEDHKHGVGRRFRYIGGKRWDASCSLEHPNLHRDPRSGEQKRRGTDISRHGRGIRKEVARDADTAQGTSVREGPAGMAQFNPIGTLGGSASS